MPAIIEPTLRRLAAPLAAVAVMLAVFVPWYAATLDRAAPLPHDGTGLVVGRDFLNLWLYGRAAWAPDPGRFYDLAAYARSVEATAGAGYPGQQWSYPPTMLLLAAPFGRLAYLPALAVWSALGPGLFVAALRPWTRERWALAAAALSPAALFGLISGQCAFLAAAAMLTAMRWRDRRPVAAGLLLGLLTVKPQIGLFIPVLLLVERRWRVIAAAGLTAAALAGVTALIWGGTVWRMYLANLGHQAMVLTDPERLAAPFMATLFMNARSAGLGVAAAGWIQAAGAVAAVLAIVLVFGRRPPPGSPAYTALFLAASAGGSAYLLSYDTLALAAAAVLLIAADERPRRLLLLAYLLPLIQMACGSRHLPGPALIPLVLAGALLPLAPWARMERPEGRRVPAEERLGSQTST